MIVIFNSESKCNMYDLDNLGYIKEQLAKLLVNKLII